MALCMRWRHSFRHRIHADFGAEQSPSVCHGFELHVSPLRWSLNVTSSSLHGWWRHTAQIQRWLMIILWSWPSQLDVIAVSVSLYVVVLLLLFILLFNVLALCKKNKSFQLLVFIEAWIIVDLQISNVAVFCADTNRVADATTVFCSLVVGNALALH